MLILASRVHALEKCGWFLPALALLVACAPTDETPNPGMAGMSGSSGSGGMAGAAGSMLTAGGGAGGGQSGAAGAAGSGGAAGGGAGGGGAGGVAGSSGSGGAAGGGAGGGGACTPVAGPGAGKMYPTTTWKAEWNVECDFETNNGCDSVMPPERAFDGKGDTRSSIGDTHIKAGSPTAQVLGDTFTFDMMACNQISKMVMFAAAPPNNNGSFDARDFPGSVEVTVSSDCATNGTTITGTFGEVVAMANEAKPGCQNDCDMPMTINFSPPVAAKCVKLELTKVLQLGGGIWWAIDELQVYQ